MTNPQAETFSSIAVGVRGWCLRLQSGWKVTNEISGSRGPWRTKPEKSVHKPRCTPWASLAQLVKNLPAMQETWVLSPGWEGLIPGGGNDSPLQYSGLENSMGCIIHGLQRVGRDWTTSTFTLHDLYPRGRASVEQTEWAAAAGGLSRKACWWALQETVWDLPPAKAEGPGAKC